MASWPEQQTNNPKSFYYYILFWRCQTNLKFEDLFGETQKKTPKSFYSFLGTPNKPKVLGRPKRKTTKSFYFFWGRMPSPYPFLGGYRQKEHTNLKATKLVMIIMFCTIYNIYIYVFYIIFKGKEKTMARYCCKDMWVLLYQPQNLPFALATFAMAIF